MMSSMRPERGEEGGEELSSEGEGKANWTLVRAGREAGLLPPPQALATAGGTDWGGLGLRAGGAAAS